MYHEYISPKRQELMWTWKSPTGIKSEIDFIITNSRDVVKNVSHCQRKLNGEFEFHFRREENKLIQKLTS